MMAVRPTNQRRETELGGPLAQTSRRRRRWPAVWTETRSFWGLFRLLLLPVGLLMLIVAFCAGMEALTGQNDFSAVSHAETGWRGFFMALVSITPWAIPFAAMVAVFLWVERTVLPAIRRRIFGPKRNR